MHSNRIRTDRANGHLGREWWVCLPRPPLPHKADIPEDTPKVHIPFQQAPCEQTLPGRNRVDTPLYHTPIYTTPPLCHTPISWQWPSRGWVCLPRSPGRHPGRHHLGRHSLPGYTYPLYHIPVYTTHPLYHTPLYDITLNPTLLYQSPPHYTTHPIQCKISSYVHR